VYTLSLRCLDPSLRFRRDEPSKLHAILARSLPHFTALRELACSIEMTVGDFNVLTHTCGNTLTKLAVHFLPSSVPDAIPLMERFVALEDLHIHINSGSMMINVHTPLILPELRRLAVDAWEDHMNKLLKSLTPSSFPKLTSFEFRRGDSESLYTTSLTEFLHVHGRNLTEIRCRNAEREITGLIFAFTPRLEHVEFIQTYDFPEVLTGLPRSVSTITVSEVAISPVSMSDVYVESPGLVEQNHYLRMLKGVEDLPRPNLLRTIRMREEGQYLELPPSSWKSIHNAVPEELKSFARHTARLLDLGIVVVDDEGAVLTEVVPLTEESI
jgi:hypothetical protein